jgi:hypothetical protein
MEPPASLLEYFEGESESRLWELADKIVEFTPIKNVYLNREVMKEDAYNALSDFMFAGNFDWDALAEDPDFEENLEDADFYDIARNIYLDILLGIKDDKIGNQERRYKRNVPLLIHEGTGDQERDEIHNLIKDTLIDMVNEYREIIENAERKRL